MSGSIIPVRDDTKAQVSSHVIYKTERGERGERVSERAREFVRVRGREERESDVERERERGERERER